MKKWIAIAMFLEASLSAHTGAGMTSGLMSGFLHPIGGMDHMSAMFAVGLWAAVIGGRALRAIPSAFILMMGFGAFLGAEGVSVPFIEEGILASVAVLGALVAMGVKPPLFLSAAIVGGFAIFHGIAHGAEMPLNVPSTEYAAGFVLATALLHGAGIVAATAFKSGVIQRVLTRRKANV